jgi:tetratricopeptide (TPR) repeat protein
MKWSRLSTEGYSVAFGRLEGRFDGTDFRNRKIELVRTDNGKEFSISVGEGLGYFEVLLPPGSYSVSALEATYRPPGRITDPTKYRPVRQRFVVNPRSGEPSRLPTFIVPEDRPVYIGTLDVDNEPDGIVYRGNYIRLVDEYDESIERLGNVYPDFVSSLSSAKIQPVRHFMLRPRLKEAPLDLVEIEDPIRRAREYISEHKYQQAINWLQTFMPASDEERNQAQLLIGEALLGDGKFPEAISLLGDSLQIDPENMRALRLLARAHLFNEDTGDALNLYQALAESLPGDAEAHLQLGYLYALSSEPSRSTVEFDSAFEYDHDYLLHDVAPFAVALKAVRLQSAEYIPPRVLRHRVRPPRSIQSRRGAQAGGLALLIDHNGRVVAAQVSPGSSGDMPSMLMAMVRATFKPAALNGVPVPSLLMLGTGGGGQPTQ